MNNVNGICRLLFDLLIEERLAISSKVYGTG